MHACCCTRIGHDVLGWARVHLQRGIEGALRRRGDAALSRRVSLTVVVIQVGEIRVWRGCIMCHLRCSLPLPCLSLPRAPLRLGPRLLAGSGGDGLEQPSEMVVCGCRILVQGRFVSRQPVFWIIPLQIRVDGVIVLTLCARGSRPSVMAVRISGIGVGLSVGRSVVFVGMVDVR